MLNTQTVKTIIYSPPDLLDLLHVVQCAGIHAHEARYQSHSPLCSRLARLGFDVYDDSLHVVEVVVEVVVDVGTDVGVADVGAADVGVDDVGVDDVGVHDVGDAVHLEDLPPSPRRWSP